VLFGENGGRGEIGDLFAGQHRFEGGAHRDFGFAEADVAAEQTVHRTRRFHVFFDVVDRFFLIGGFFELKVGFEVLLERVVGFESEARGFFTLGVQRDEFFGDVFDLGADALLGLRPIRAAEFA